MRILKLTCIWYKLLTKIVNQILKITLQENVQELEGRIDDKILVG